MPAEQLRNYKGEKKIFPPATAFAFTGDTGEHMGGRALFWGLIFRRHSLNKGSSPRSASQKR